MGRKQGLGVNAVWLRSCADVLQMCFPFSLSLSLCLCLSLSLSLSLCLCLSLSLSLSRDIPAHRIFLRHRRMAADQRARRCWPPHPQDSQLQTAHGPGRAFRFTPPANERNTHTRARTHARTRVDVEWTPEVRKEHRRRSALWLISHHLGSKHKTQTQTHKRHTALDAFGHTSNVMQPSDHTSIPGPKGIPKYTYPTQTMQFT